METAPDKLARLVAELRLAVIAVELRRGRLLWRRMRRDRPT
jgi:hypothetical protein